MGSRLMPRLLAAIALLTAPVGVGAQTFGAGVTLKEVTPFTRVIERPNTLEGQTILIEGVIASVCTKTPCAWMGLSGIGGSDYGNPVLVRFDPARIVFPKSAMGKRVLVEGVIQSVARAPDPDAKTVAAEYGQENGGAPPLWELKVTGAVIQ